MVTKDHLAFRNELHLRLYSHKVMLSHTEGNCKEKRGLTKHMRSDCKQPGILPVILSPAVPALAGAEADTRMRRGALDQSAFAVIGLPVCDDTLERNALKHSMRGLSLRGAAALSLIMA